MTAKYTFTVFTPTYNRAHTLPRVYESLKKQTFRDFEWLIVDDGSTDGTRELVESWLAESPFPIRYFWQENRHKKVAFNRGVRAAQGRFFLTLDSDDECVPSALERFLWHWNNIPLSQQERFSGVTALCMNEEGRIVGEKFPCKDYIDSDSLEIWYRYGVKGEKWGFIKTEILKLYPFPEDVDGHVPEGIVWSEIGKRYKTRFVNEVLRIYYQKDQGRLMNSGDVEKNAHGHFIWMEYILENEISWFRYKPTWFLKVAANYTRFGWYARKKIAKQSFHTKSRLAKTLIVMMFPVGLLRVVLDKLGKLLGENG